MSDKDKLINRNYADLQWYNCRASIPFFTWTAARPLLERFKSLDKVYYRLIKSIDKVYLIGVLHIYFNYALYILHIYFIPLQGGTHWALKSGPLGRDPAFKILWILHHCWCVVILGVDGACDDDLASTNNRSIWLQNTNNGVNVVRCFSYAIVLWGSDSHFYNRYKLRVPYPLQQTIVDSMAPSRLNRPALRDTNYDPTYKFPGPGETEDHVP